jgi:hypothetical protein
LRRRMAGQQERPERQGEAGKEKAGRHLRAAYSLVAQAGYTDEIG